MRFCPALGRECSRLCVCGCEVEKDREAHHLIEQSKQTRAASLKDKEDRLTERRTSEDAARLAFLDGCMLQLLDAGLQGLNARPDFVALPEGGEIYAPLVACELRRLNFEARPKDREA